MKYTLHTCNRRLPLIKACVILFIFCLPFSVQAGDEILFCFETQFLQIGEQAFLTGQGYPIEVGIPSGGRSEHYTAFYKVDGVLENKGLFQGRFETAVSYNGEIYILDGKSGILKYVLTGNDLKYKEFFPVPDGLIPKDAEVHNGIMFILFLSEEKTQFIICSFNGTVFSKSREFVPFPAPKDTFDIRFTFTEDGPVISWREKKREGISCLMWDSHSWERHDFRRTALNCYDISSEKKLYFIEKESANKENLIAYSLFRDGQWGGAVPILLSTTGYGEKYQSVRVTAQSDGQDVLVRSHYTPFGIYGSDIFRETEAGWISGYTGTPLISFLFYLCAAICGGGIILSLLLQKWLPSILYRKFQTIQVGTLFSRAAGYFIDSTVAGGLALLIVGRFRIQDMSGVEYRYIFYILFLSCLYIYGLAGEFFTGRTFGKLVLGLCLRNNIGMKCSLREIMIRNLIKLFELHMWVIPAVTIIFTEKNQRLGDLFAGTRVQKKEY